MRDLQIRERVVATVTNGVDVVDVDIIAIHIASTEAADVAITLDDCGS